jgi:hypothetical protein
MNTRAYIKLGCGLAVLFVFSHEAAWTQVLDRIAAFREQERRAVAEPFKGVTTDGNIVPGLFKISATGVATKPVREAADAYLNGLAFSAIDAMKLGRGAGTDFLAISFSALDLTGHSYGPGSHEVQDILINLDVQIGLLLDKLDRDLGAGNYVVGLSADHGVSPIPERLKSEGFDAGRIDTAGIGRAIDAVLAKELGPGAYRTRVLANDVYFNDGVYFKLTQNPAAMRLRQIRRRMECLL